MKTTQREHIAWIDLIRIIACFLVVVSHSCDSFVAKTDSNYTEFLTGAYIGSFVRACVPLFVMISGVLLLPVKMDMPSFYARRTKRLLIPFIFWSIALPFLYYFYFHSGFEFANTNNAIVGSEHTITATLTKLYTFIFNFNYDTIPLWYLYMLIGLYLFLPILSGWLKQASKRDIHYFLGIWVFTMCIPYIEMAAPLIGFCGYGGNPSLFGVCDWNAYGTFYYFSGFIGYLVLAYYLVKHPLNWSWKRTLSVAIPMFVIGYIITAVGFILTQKTFPEDFSKLEIVWNFAGINVGMMTVAIFITVQKLDFKASSLLKKVASLTFGIYLSHFFFVQFSYDVIYSSISIPPFFQIVLIAISSFILSAVLMWLMSLNKFTRKLIM